MFQVQDTNPSSLIWVKDWISQHTGIQFPEHKLSVLEQRLLALCHRLEIQSIELLIEELKHSDEGDLLPHIIDAATTNHTHFFRETENIKYFIESIVPSFENETRLRVWSAASSTGEELYTILMMLGETHSLLDIRNKFSFLGTDVSPKVIQHAEKAQYNQQRVEELPQPIKSKWFTQINKDCYQLSKQLTTLCLFRRFNLLSQSWPFQNQFHVIFLRNVLYYFDQPTQKKILDALYRHTLPGGWLITSVTESIGELNVRWRRVRSGVFQK